ncbi:hypothetical protein MCOR02_000064 [Pyricularia oryzae]|uniref:Uncharacterized protein n=1 Tax=Pyricularia oryzae TaxID=318829 RepID=A0A4P7NSF5_PYROR|nr:hypothetical protein MCOR02_000064 [Pyricularia oryzae]QBZ65383.1 hypothetical protein PoMZ_12342 [Pyricularia oryzae]
MCICLKGSESWAACRCFVTKTYSRPLGPQKPTFEWDKIQGEVKDMPEAEENREDGDSAQSDQTGTEE